MEIVRIIRDVRSPNAVQSAATATGFAGVLAHARINQAFITSLGALPAAVVLRAGLFKLSADGTETQLGSWVDMVRPKSDLSGDTFIAGILPGDTAIASLGQATIGVKVQLGADINHPVTGQRLINAADVRAEWAIGGFTRSA
jgi:hypothetical protein